VILPERGLNHQSLSRGGGARFLRNHHLFDLTEQVADYGTGSGSSKNTVNDSGRSDFFDFADNDLGMSKFQDYMDDY